jgi:hypothetical protein
MGTRIAGAVVSLAGGGFAVVILSPERIGVFLALTSLAAFAGVADLGLNYSFLLAASSGGPTEASLLASTAGFAAVAITAITGSTLFIVGVLFLKGSGLVTATWLWPWASYCVLAAGHQVLLLALTYVEGTGKRHSAWRIHFWIEVIAGVGFVMTVALQTELWAPSASMLIRVGAILLAFVIHFDLPDLATHKSLRAQFALWHEELWPMQWRSLVNVLVGLLTTRLLTPILLAAQGPTIAGRVGLVLSLSMVIVGTTSAWPLSQTAVFSSLFHQGDSRGFATAARRALVVTMTLTASFIVGAGSLCEVLRIFSAHMADRLPQSATIWLILIAALFGSVSYCCAILLRAQRRDPVVVPNIMLSLPTLVAFWLTALASPLIFAATYSAAAFAFALLYGGFLMRFLGNLRYR